MITNYEIYTDGSSLGNPGWSGAAFVDIFSGQIVESGKRHLGTATNNFAELTAIEMALDYLATKDLKPTATITIYSDSRYAIDALGRYIHNWKKNGFRTAKNKPVANKELILSIDEKLTGLRAKLSHAAQLRFIHVPGHADVFGNEVADKLAGDAARERATNSGDQATLQPPRPRMTSALFFTYADKLDKKHSLTNDQAFAASMLRRAAETLKYYEQKYGPIPEDR